MKFQLSLRQKQVITIVLPCLLLLFWASSWTRDQSTIDNVYRITTTYGYWSGNPTYRQISAYERDGAEGHILFLFHGPLSKSGKRHGKWTTLTMKNLVFSAQYYWYGEVITEGDWHLRN